jgi:chromosome segregation ATPase
MSRGGKMLSVLVVVVLGAWGCARGPSNHTVAQAERIRSLEGKCAKLEEDYRAVAGARDQARKKASSLEEDVAHLQQELAGYKAVLKERDALRHQVEARTNERDGLQLRCDRLKKGLQNLIGQDDAMLPPSPPAPISAPTLSTPS